MKESRERVVIPNIPQLDMSSILESVTDFAGVKTAIVEAIRQMKSQGATHIGFVSGPLGNTSSFVDDETGTAREKSMRAMEEVTKKMVDKHKIPIFSSTDIFRTSWNQLAEAQQIKQGVLIDNEKERVMNELFRGILEEGGITDIFMMKGWKKAPGSLYEHVVAEKLGITIWYI